MNRVSDAAAARAAEAPGGIVGNTAAIAAAEAAMVELLLEVRAMNFVQ